MELVLGKRFDNKVSNKNQFMIYGEEDNRRLKK